MDELLSKITNKSAVQIEKEEKRKEKGEERASNSSRTLIIIHRNNETLKSFQRQFLSFNSSSIGDSTSNTSTSTSLLSFSNIKLDDVSIDTYCCPFDDEEGINLIKMAKIFLKSVKEENVHWIILLDWSIYDQQRWLGHILKCVGEIDSEGKEDQKHVVNKTIICINSEHIYKIQKNLPLWYSHHIDYIQQTLRWYSLRKHCNLMYSEAGQKKLSDELIKKIVNINSNNKFGIEDVEMAKTTRILIPYGYDNIKLIKTLDETFDAEECTIERYEEVIPTPIDKSRQTGSILIDSIEPSVEYFDVTERLDINEITRHKPEFIDEQIQYRRLLEYSKKLNRK